MTTRYQRLKIIKIVVLYCLKSGPGYSSASTLVICFLEVCGLTEELLVLLWFVILSTIGISASLSIH